jgi:hypothetical protein
MDVKRTMLGVAIALTLIGVVTTAAEARPKAKPKVTVTPQTVMAGNAITVGLTRTRGKTCRLSIHRDRFGAKARIKRKIVRGRTLIGIRSSTPKGRWRAVVRCGRRTGSAGFKVAAPSSGNTQGKTNAPSAGLGEDEQGFVARNSGSQEDVGPDGQLGAGDYANARIADIALSELGHNRFTPGALDHGQCKQSVNDWVAAASGGTQRLGGDYYGNYARNGGVQIARDAAVKGDIIQLDNPADTRSYYHGMHTAVVVSHNAGSNAFDVVDSNFKLDDVVRRHDWDPYAAAAKYGLRITIWRMGAAESASAPTPQPAPQPTPAPPPPTTYAETTGGATNTWTNYTNAGGYQGPTIPAFTTVQIACRLTGFRVADGNTWWYRIAQSPWNGAYYASADAFYNNGATSGTLHGTPFVDANVPSC